MRIFHYWTRIEQNIEVDGQTQLAQCVGGSNVSQDAARADAHQRMSHVVDRINGRNLADPDYEADIIEEVLFKLDEHNIVTRNRYGAEVLNSSKVLFIDIDEPRYRFWDILSFFQNTAQKKKRIIDFVKRQALKPAMKDLGVRLYETHKGIRAIVTGAQFDPRSDETSKLLDLFNADSLYAMLCKKQNCFRARLTPKPYRIKCPTHRVVFPREDAAAESALVQWLAEYNQRKAHYSTCKYLCSLGLDQSNAVVDYHDKSTGAFSELRLA